jgi:hypothetical protein
LGKRLIGAPLFNGKSGGKTGGTLCPPPLQRVVILTRAFESKLYVTLKYLREYRTMDSIAAEYHVREGTVCLSIQWVEDTLKEVGRFKRLLNKSNDEEIKIRDYFKQLCGSALLN